jgi:hypothetical protein
MQFYFIDEDNSSIKVDGTNEDLLVELTLLAKKQKRHSGFVGVLAMSGAIRGTLQWRTYEKNAYTKISTFVRKYKALEALETLSTAIKADIADGLIEP